jgi:hypothetical protein
MSLSLSGRVDVKSRALLMKVRIVHANRTHRIRICKEINVFFCWSTGLPSPPPPPLANIAVTKTSPVRTLSLSSSCVAGALQMHCTENSKEIFPEMKLCAALFPISTFMICERFINYDQYANAIQHNRRTDRGNI